MISNFYIDAIIFLICNGFLTKHFRRTLTGIHTTLLTSHGLQFVFPRQRLIYLIVTGFNKKER